MRVPVVTSAPEHLGSTRRHKGASVRAGLHVEQRGGRLSQGGRGHPGMLGEGHRASSTCAPGIGSSGKGG